MLHETLLWLFVIFSGLAVGAGLYELRVNVPRWFRRAGRSGMRIDAEALPPGNAERMALRWVRLNYLRAALALLGWLAALRALSLSG
jgi:hypothetical protein